MDNLYSLDDARRNKEVSKEALMEKIAEAENSIEDCEDPTCDCCHPETAHEQGERFKITISLDPPDSFWEKEHYGRISVTQYFDTMEEAADAYRKIINDDDMPEGLKLEDNFAMQRYFRDRD